MKVRNFFPYTLIFGITIIFFYKSFLLYQVPFPGDLLISEYAPWKYENYLGYNPGSYPNKAQYSDVLRQLYPWKMMVIEELKKGSMPLWNPYNFSGSPLLANHQSSVFNPFNIIFFFLKPSIAWSIFIIIQPLLASLFMFLYLRQIKLTQEASLLGSISYGFSLFMGTFLEYGNFGHTIMWLPLSLYIVERINQEKKGIFLFLLPVVIALTIFSGHLQLAFGSLIFLLLYILFKSQQKIRLLILFILGIGISAVQLIPTIELIGYSARVPHEIKIIMGNFLLQIHQLIAFISPDTYGNPATRNYLLDDTYSGNAFYIGISPLLFALYASIKFKQNFYIKYFGMISIAFLILLTNNPISYFFYSLKLPLLSTSAPSNFIFLLTFSLSVLGAAGFTIWQKKKDLNLLIVLGVLFAVSLLLLGAHEIYNITYMIKQAAFGLGVMFVVGIGIILARLVNRKAILYLFLVITCFELFYYFQKFNPFVPKSLMYPKTQLEQTLLESDGYNRYWGISAANPEANFSTVFKIYSPEGYDPLYPKWYDNFISGSSGTFSTRSDAKVLGLGKIVDELGVKIVLDRVENGSTAKTIPANSFELKKSFGGWKIYENKNAMPRVFTISSRCSSAMSLSQCFTAGYLFEGNILSYKPMEVRIKSGSASGYLVLTDAYYPGWKAYSSNGKELKISPFNGTFRGIKNISAGEEIVFKYQPDSFKWGVIVTIISIVVVLIFVRFYRYE